MNTVKQPWHQPQLKLLASESTLTGQTAAPESAEPTMGGGEPG